MTWIARRPLALSLVCAVLGLAAPSASADDDAMTQCIAASNKGLDLRKQGKLAESRRILAACASAACSPEISAVCQKRIAEINAAMPSIILLPKDGAGRDVVGVQVTIDGAPSGQTLDGRPIAVDPGPHVFRVLAPGQPPVERPFVIAEGAKDRRDAWADATVADVALVAGGVALVAAATLFFTAPKAATTGVLVAPAVARDSAGVAVTGVFQ